MTLKIGIIDSGKGGQYFGYQLQKVLKKEVELFAYKAFYFESYGTVSKQRLFCMCDSHLDYLIDKCDVDIIVVACMTLSTNCLEYIKQRAKDIPVYDLYTSLPYLDDNTVVFATENTINSGRFDYCRTLPTASLASYIQTFTNDQFEFEDKKTSEKMVKGLINAALWSKSIEAERSIIVLGCSHYPIVTDIFEKYLKPAYIVDPIYFCIESLREETLLHNYFKGE